MDFLCLRLVYLYILFMYQRNKFNYKPSASSKFQFTYVKSMWQKGTTHPKLTTWFSMFDTVNKFAIIFSDSCSFYCS